MAVVNVVARLQCPFWVVLEFLVDQVYSCHVGLEALYHVERKNVCHLLLGIIGVPGRDMDLDPYSAKD